MTMTMPSPDSWLDPLLIGWFVLTALSVGYVAWDAFTRNPEMKVMKWGWLLVTLYGGPIMAAAYVLSCQEPPNQRHEDFIRPLWKQAFGSSIHCMAGDATGVIVAAAITTALGLPMWLDVTAEYVFGFGFGLFIFQALFMRDMAGGSYIRALRMSFVPEWLSMNAVMAGMIPTMVLLMSRDMAAMHASSLRFWGVMSLATLVGFATAYPINLWLVGVRLKHGMGTERALGQGGHDVSAERPPPAMPGMTHDMAENTEGMALNAGVTNAQIAAMTVLTLMMLAGGNVIATLFGRWTM
ncbi:MULTISPECIES: DUF4396 domain-containing protein [Sphingomonas]|uniref:DUF4396 domain-containing protein n=1 Tax=Sphingomonas TaxID=13687 RepID=UPI001F08226D|nr:MULTISPECIES: DUF4396 domain-containing protein [Sphingomonas]